MLLVARAQVIRAGVGHVEIPIVVLGLVLGLVLMAHLALLVFQLVFPSPAFLSEILKKFLLRQLACHRSL